MNFQGRGKVYLQERLANGELAAGVEICPDVYDVGLATDTWQHFGKCGAVDAVDASGTKSQTATVSLTFIDVNDYNFAIATLGTVNIAASGTITDELVSATGKAGFYSFVGGKHRRRNITALSLEDHSTSPATPLVANTDYTLDAVTGKIKWLDDVDGPIYASTYGYSDPASVAMMTAGQKEYFASFDGLNRLNANDPTSMEMFRVKFQPAKTISAITDENQSMELTGDALADPDIEATDTVLGQFGRRLLSVPVA